MMRDEHVVVTGGASGIGLATAHALLDRGARVTVIDVGGEAVAAAEDRLDGEDIVFIRADVSDEEDMAEAFEDAAAEYGPVTGLVNAANILRVASVEDTSAELFRQIVDINLTGAFIACRAALDQMGDRLSIVNVASVSGIRASAGRVAYGASKAGIILMSQVMAVELGGNGIRVNAVAPGPIQTDAVTRQHSAEERARWTQMVPQCRYGQPEEVAAAILFLLSEEASYINGQVIAVDGGFTPAGLIRPSGLSRG
jgi:NAD(P)-dependent dehydrogenase (short-subunit alcohol dehydrogenase family)